jgi:transcriptional regulator with XRE-family HTH domain
MSYENNQQALLALAQRLAKAREELGMKQDTAAKALQISRSTLSKYENGDLRGLTIDCLLAMSSLYKKTLLSFFPNEQAINFVFNPSDGAMHNQQAYTLHTQADGYREMIAHLKEEIDFLRTKLG